MTRAWRWSASVRGVLTVMLSGCEGAVLNAVDDHRVDVVLADGAVVPVIKLDDGGLLPAPRSDAATPDGPTSDGGGTTPGSGSDGGGGVATTTQTCDAPIALVDTGKPTSIVGTGTGTCTEAAFATALKKGGIITFDCGDDATLAITSEHVFPSGVDTTIDGNGKVTLDGQGKTRILSFTGTDFQKTKTKLTLQRLRLINGKASGTMQFAAATAPCSQGYQDGGGGALYVRDADLRIIDCTFDHNQCATPGPDVAGGAVYVVGTLAATVVGSTFSNNQGSNGGAIGALFGNLSVYNSVFTDNQATGSGANSVNGTCPEVDGQREVGSGGNGGAIVMDGGESFSVVLCGSTFRHNIGGAGALGGAVFRTPDIDVQSTEIDRCTFDGNESATGGALYFHHSKLTIEASTFSNNVGHDGTGGIQVDDTVLSITNSTFSKNQALRAAGGGNGPRGGAITNYGNSGTIQNCTFLGNTAPPGNGSAGGALIGATLFTVSNSLFVDNQTLGDACDGSASGSNNLQWPGGGTLCAQGAMASDPQLGALQDNGGPTATVLPASGSAAAKAGSNCPKTDQRGYARGAVCSLGAVEIGASAP